MSAIGMIVLIGILDNDSILKIDTMNRSANSMDLISAIKLSGKKAIEIAIDDIFDNYFGASSCSFFRRTRFRTSKAIGTFCNWWYVFGAIYIIVINSIVLLVWS